MALVQLQPPAVVPDADGPANVHPHALEPHVGVDLERRLGLCAQAHEARGGRPNNAEGLPQRDALDDVLALEDADGVARPAGTSLC